mmetsp:Transcript_40652/g.106852  ORF Transcript_40652/g.106852 Transcript_40652/m.106852 type:complete len:83 (-) Transcript_40652:784-1032(-)
MALQNKLRVKTPPAAKRGTEQLTDDAMLRVAMSSKATLGTVNYPVTITTRTLLARQSCIVDPSAPFPTMEETPTNSRTCKFN